MNRSVRRWLLGCVGVLLVSAAAAEERSRPPAASAVMFKSDPQLRNVVTDAVAPRRLIGVRYTFATGSPVRATPALAGGVVYVGNTEGTLFAIDAERGSERWRVALGAPIESSPAVVDGVVFVATRGNVLHARSARDGHALWRVDLGRDLEPRNYWDFYVSSPVPVGPLLYIGSGDGHLRAIDRRSGQIRWSHDAGSRIRSTPAVSESLVVFATMSGHVIALDRASGRERWKFASQGAAQSFALRSNDTTAIYASPSIADGVVTIGGRDGNVYGLDLATGALKWQTTHDGMSWILSTAIDRGSVIVGSGSAALLQAADLQTGVERWRYKTATAVFASPTVVGSVVLAADFSGRLAAVDADSGAELWRLPLGERVFATPVAAGRIVYVVADDGVLVALDVAPDEAPARPPLKRYVYWEGRHPDDAFPLARGGLDIALREHFEGNGYARLDAAGLGAALRAPSESGERSVIVFAANRLPPALLEASGNAPAPLRGYLEAGGRVVFLGPNPAGFQYDRASGAVLDLDPQAAERVLGLRYPAVENERGPHIATPTAEGRAWGLRGQQVVNGGVDPAQTSLVLARNQFGLATSWLRRYGERGGTLLQLTAPSFVAGSLTPFVIAAEHGL